MSRYRLAQQPRGRPTEHPVIANLLQEQPLEELSTRRAELALQLGERCAAALLVASHPQLGLKRHQLLVADIRQLTLPHIQYAGALEAISIIPCAHLA